VLLVLGALASPAGCGEEEPNVGSPDKEVCLVRADGTTRYCIDTYEASRSDATATEVGAANMAAPRSLDGRLPWTQLTWSEARAACELRGRRLCERDEWLDACDGVAGPGGALYTYGDTLAADTCNTSGVGVEAGGARAGCKSSGAVFDLSGNVREWTGNVKAAAAARGGSFRSSTTHECTSGDTAQLQPPDQGSAEVGYRCCRDG
jgi:formylglycine-generating enzyme required for sulfatase activity